MFIKPIIKCSPQVEERLSKLTPEQRNKFDESLAQAILNNMPSEKYRSIEKVILQDLPEGKKDDQSHNNRG